MESSHVVREVARLKHFGQVGGMNILVSVDVVILDPKMCRKARNTGS